MLGILVSITVDFNSKVFHDDFLTTLLSVESLSFLNPTGTVFSLSTSSLSPSGFKLIDSLETVCNLFVYNFSRSDFKLAR